MTLQQPGVRGELRRCPVCGAKRVRYYADRGAVPAYLQCGACGASARVPARPVDRTAEAVEATRLAMRRNGPARTTTIPH